MKLSLFLISAALYQAHAIIDPNLAKTPQMGWNSWNKYGCDVSADTMLKMGEALVSTGLRDLGYKYLNIDDCWADSDRDNQTQRMVPNATRFPDGIDGLAQKVHAMGLKLGIYSSAGTHTCQARYPGSLGYEQIDAQAWSDWGVDYLKYDNCYNNGEDGSPAISSARYKKMGDALANTSRPIFYSICSWGQDSVWEWGRDVGGQSWRMSGDINDSWNSVLSIEGQEEPIYNYSSPGGWNDMDMLEVGVFDHMTVTEYTSHFSLWAAYKSPLILGLDVSNMTTDIKNIISNKEVIAINQDPLGKSVQVISSLTNAGQKVLSGPLQDGSTVVLALNLDGSNVANITVDWASVIPNDPAAGHATYYARDLWQHKSIGKFKTSVTVNVEPHGVSMLKVSKNRV
ncbi:alpha-galactosidase [Gongronella butleri]|nr:alpha-galactosidase [Gongronella butleri]